MLHKCRNKFIFQVVKENLAKEQICVHLERKVNVTAADNDFDQLVTDIIYSSGDVKITILFVDPEVRLYSPCMLKCYRIYI